MKTLNQEIENIKNAKTSRANKKQALVSLGLVDYEVRLIMASLVSQGSPRVSYTFGVEIECGVPRHALRNAANHTGFNYQYEDYNHIDGRSYFKFVHDGSLRLDNAIECVSPVLKGSDGKRTLKVACQTLNQAGANVDSSCGLHVHIGADGLTDEQYCNVFVNYLYLESLVDSFMAPSRRDNTYAKSLRHRDESIKNARTIDEMRDVLGSRYFKVNAESYRRHKTIEFRQHQGSTNFDKIFNWVSFCGKLVNWSKNNRLDHHIADVDEIPFLNDAEKRFFNGRIRNFANN